MNPAALLGIAGVVLVAASNLYDLAKRV